MNSTKEKEVLNMAKTEKKEITAKTITEHLQDVEEKKTKAQLANDKRLYNRYKKQIDSAYKKMENCYLDTAIAIHSIYKKGLYKLDNFKNIYDFAKENYDISRGTCCKFINICERFGVIGETDTVVGLQDRFKEYGVSQLGVMLTFPDALLNQVQPTQSVRDLKQMAEDYKHSLDEQRELVETANKKMIESVIPEETPINPPEESDVEIMNKDTFVCQASSMKELLSLQEVIADTFKDVLKNHSTAKIRVNIVY